MSRLEEAERAVSQLSPDEWREFLRWLGQQGSPRRSAHQLANDLDGQIACGQAEPLKYLDLSQFSESGRRKAEAIRVGRGR